MKKAERTARGTPTPTDIWLLFHPNWPTLLNHFPSREEAISTIVGDSSWTLMHVTYIENLTSTTFTRVEPDPMPKEKR